MSIQSLHGHTTTSDGTLSYTEYLNIAHQHKISTIAFTDHDSLPNESAIKLLQDNKKHPTKWIMGIEASSGLPKEIGGGPYSGFHIVGLFVDPTNRALLEHCNKAQLARVTRMEKMVKNLKGLGFEIEISDCLQASGGEAVGRPHIVQALNSKPNNAVVLDSIRKQMEIAAGSNDKIKYAYDEMINRGDSQYPYVLFLSDNSFIPNIYVEYEYWTDMDQTVALIRNAGGLAFIAHYSTVKSKIPYSFLEKIISEKRIDGMEVVYGLWGENSSEGREWAIDRKIVKQYVTKYNSLSSGGADTHRPEDFELLTASPDYMTETSGLAEQIMKQSKVNVEWSSY